MTLKCNDKPPRNLSRKGNHSVHNGKISDEAWEDTFGKKQDRTAREEGRGSSKETLSGTEGEA